MSQVIRRRLWPIPLTASDIAYDVDPEEVEVVREVAIEPSEPTDWGSRQGAQSGRDALLAKINKPPRKKT